MRSPRRRIKAQKGEIPMSSMIDVVFLLLIYFIVVHKPIVSDTLLGANLPGPGRSKSKTPIEFMKIDVIQVHRNPDKDINYYLVNGNLWKAKDLGPMLKKAFKNNDGSGLVINCGPNAEHRKLVKLLDMCEDANIKKLNIVNDAGRRHRPRSQ